MADYNIGDIFLKLQTNTAGASKSLNSVNKRMEKLAQTLSTIENTNIEKIGEVFDKIGYKAVPKANKELTKTNDKVKNLKKNADKTSSSFKNMFSLGRIYFWLNYTKRIGTGLANIANNAVAYNETLNKFQVSMGANYDQALKFVNSITKAFNLSSESIMNYQSTFKNMLDALGDLSADTTYQLSETLTRMAIDYASLFNVSIDRAMSQFQSVLSGQIKSIRSVSGYDVSEASIFNIYKELGGTKTMRQLDQTEKRLLRIIALQRQMSKTGALGDFPKTINQSANMLKAMAETIKEISTWLGQLILHDLSKILEKALGGLVALREMIKALNIARGYKPEDFGGKSLFGELEESATGANEAIENLKSSLLGFDKLNVLGATNTGSIADYSLLTNEIKKYANSLEGVKNNANDIANNILRWLGYTKEGEGYTLQTGARLYDILDIIKLIGKTIAGGALYAFFAKKLLPAITSAFKFIKGIKLEKVFGTAFGPVGVLVTLLTTIIGSFINLATTSKQFQQMMSSTFGLLFKSIGTMYALVEPVFSFVLKIISRIWSFIEFHLAASILYWINLLNIGLSFISSLITSVKEGRWAFEDFFASLGNLGQLAINWINKLFEIFGVINFYNLLDKWGQQILDSGFFSLEFWGNLFNNIKTAFKNFLNYIIDGINGITSKLTHISIPDFLGGGSIGINIPQIPHLANGGVIDRPTQVLMGEYAGARSNKEIATPENLMRSIFLESLLPVAQAIVQGDREVVNAIEDLSNRPINLNGRKVSENIYENLKRTAERKGDLMFG